MALESITDLKTLDAELAADHLRGLWAREETVRREPAPFGKPILWKWAKISAGLEAAGRLITTNYKGARRAISLVHPNMSDSTTHTLNMAVQLVKAGEAVYSHRHTNAAMRFVIDGGDNVYTITNGEKCMMRRGDLVIQPSWGWHNHINETKRDAIWIDGLDSGLMRSLRTMFQEPHPAEDLRLYNSAVETTAAIPACSLLPAKVYYPWFINGTRAAVHWRKCCRKRKRVRWQMFGIPQSRYRRSDVSNLFLLDPTTRCRQTDRRTPPHLEPTLLRRRGQRRHAKSKVKSLPGKAATFS